jgi:uncharacterized membrane protein YkoI
MTISQRISVVAALSTLTVLTVAQEQEKRIRRSDLPAAVERTVKEESQNATIRGFSEERENGQTLYEAELLVNGRTKDVLIDPHGSVIEVEQQIPTESLSSAVRQGLQAKAGHGKIVKVESITKKGNLVAYEAKVVTDGKRSEIQVGPDGKSLDHEE